MSETAGTAQHWDAAYGHGATMRSWYQGEAARSLRMLDRCQVTSAGSVIDVGGGASVLVDALLARGHRDVSVLDISAAGLRAAQDRLGAAAVEVDWLIADVLTWRPARTWQVWHDRAVFHFLTEARSRARYLDALHSATLPDAVLVMATFAADGPERCSGLPVARYSADELGSVLGVAWRLIGDDREQHRTPTGAVQPFTWAAFRRLRR